MSKITHDEYIRSLPQNIEPIGLYVNSRTKIQVKCKICNYIWHAPSRSFKKGHGCPECGKKISLSVKKWNITQEQFLNKIPSDLSSNILVLDTYAHQRGEIKVKCLKCDDVWISQPCRLYKGYGCEKCARKLLGVKSRKSHEQFIADIENVHDGSIKVLSNYIHNDEIVNVRCLICNNEFNKIAKRLLQRGCSNCFCSKGERKIKRILSENNINYVTEYSFEDLLSVRGIKLRFDFAIFKNGKLSHLIEYDGIQHIMPLNYSDSLEAFDRLQIHDNMKNEYCHINNISLIRISFTQFRNLNLEMLINNGT